MNQIHSNSWQNEGIRGNGSNLQILLILNSRENVATLVMILYTSNMLNADCNQMGDHSWV